MLPLLQLNVPSMVPRPPLISPFPQLHMSIKHQVLSRVTKQSWKRSQQQLTRDNTDFAGLAKEREIDLSAGKGQLNTASSPSLDGF